MGTSVKLEDIATRIPREDAKFHKDTVADLLHRHNTNFPGAQPVSFARKHLQELQKVDYFVAEKTDGIRCLLYLTQLPDDQNGGFFETQFLVDRKNEYYFIKRGYLHMPAPGPNNQPFDPQSYHLNTILDGELVRQRFPGGKEQLTFLIFDGLAVDNEDITSRHYEKRLGKIDHFIFRPWKAFAQKWPEDAAAQPFQLEMKRPQFPYAVEQLVKQDIPRLPHVNDGLIFTCRDTPYVPGTDQYTLKWKPPHENTVDFRLQLGAFPMAEDEEGRYEDFDQKPEIELLVYHGGTEYRKFTNLHLTDEEWEAMKSANQTYDWRIIECWREAETGRWRPKLDDGLPRFRDDKEHANHNSVVDSVLESIEDAVSEEELISMCPRLREGWKAREAERKQRAQQQAEMEQRKRHEAAAKAQQAPKPPAEVKQEPKREEDDGPGYTD